MSSRRGAGGIGVGAAGVGAKAGAGAGAEAVGAARAAAAELKPEQQASHWHGKCNLLCKMKNTRRVEAEHRPRGTAQTDPQRHGVIETDKHTEGRKECAERKREREGQPQWEPHNARYYRANNNGTTGGYKHNSIFI